MRRFLLASLLLGTAPVAQAQQLDLSHGGPVEVTARDGIDWHQNEQQVIARGDARAVRDNVTVTADRLIAYYRKKKVPEGAAKAVTPAAASVPAPPGGSDTGANEIYRLEAEGNVHIYTQTDQAVGDHAVYDIDQAVLVLTGHNLRLTTPQDVLTARDSMEYWSQRHMAVGRGSATVTTNDGRRLEADTLVGYTVDNSAPPPAAAPARPARPPHAGASADPLAASGKLQRVEAFGHVVVRTATETVHGDRGVYVPDTGIARLAGNVHITRGENQLNGAEALVNLRTGISTLVEAPGARVEGLVVPNETGTQTQSGPAKTKPGPAKPGKAGR